VRQVSSMVSGCAPRASRSGRQLEGLEDDAEKWQPVFRKRSGSKQKDTLSSDLVGSKVERFEGFHRTPQRGTNRTVSLICTSHAGRRWASCSRRCSRDARRAEFLPGKDGAVLAEMGATARRAGPRSAGGSHLLLEIDTGAVRKERSSSSCATTCAGAAEARVGLSSAPWCAHHCRGGGPRE